MKPYEFISHIVSDTISKTLDTDAYGLFFFSGARYDPNTKADPNNLTPYDELHHIFLFNTHGYQSKWIDSNSITSDFFDQHSKANFIDHSFEPLNVNLDKDFWDSVKQQPVKNIILHSEKNSNDLHEIGLPAIHWFSHAYICSEIYFKHYNKLNMVTDYKSRPIRSPWISANRLLRKHRTDFLELLDLDKGFYSFLNPDPNGQTYDGPVPARSFDDHGNDSAEIKVNDLTPWNTSFLHIVNETVWQDKIHFTEKVFKPVVLHQPFVVLQAPGSLAYLRSYGFKTFGDWWDESYDTIENPDQRMQAIADIVNAIGSKSIEELETMRMEMASVLEHNFRHFYENIPAICLDELCKGIANL
jgi:hypothetical protein